MLYINNVYGVIYLYVVTNVVLFLRFLTVVTLFLFFLCEIWGLMELKVIFICWLGSTDMMEHGYNITRTHTLGYRK